MSLVSSLMSGGFYGANVDNNKYDYDSGPLRIATESVEELHEIFLTSFQSEYAEINAIREGLDVLDSSYSIVYEASITDTFQKIKEFFKRLWDKIKGFFKSIEMYFTSSRMKAKEFVTKYREQIDGTKNRLEHFKYKMFKYDNDKIDSIQDMYFDIDVEIDGYFKDLVRIASNGKDTSKHLDSYERRMDSVDMNDEEKSRDAVNVSKNVIKNYDKLKSLTDSDECAKYWSKHTFSGINVGKVTKFDDVASACFAAFRDGAKTPDDKSDIKVKDLSSYVNVLLKSNVDKVDTISKDVDKMYSTIIERIDVIADRLKSNDKSLDNVIKKMNTAIDDDSDLPIEKRIDYMGSASKDVDNWAAVSNAQLTLRLLTNFVSLLQNCNNTLFKEWRNVISERENTYKSLIVSAFSYANTHKKLISN